MENIIKTVIELGNFKTLIRLIQKAGLTQNLSNNGQYTFFAPTDVAFSKYSTDKIENLLKDKDRLNTVLKAHIISKKILSSSLANTKKMKSINGKDLIISTAKGLRINDINLIKTDIECSNGIIHMIDNVMFLK